MASGEINWEKRNRMLDGLNGANPYRQRRPMPTTKKQYDYIMDMVKELEEHGVPAMWVVEQSDFEKCSANAINVTRALRALKQKHGLFEETVTEYVNLCKHKETGKKIKYRTTKFCGHPAGYEFLGMLYKETKIVEPA